MELSQLERRRKEWSRNQTRLRNLLAIRKDFDRALPLFLLQHGVVHTKRMARGIPWSFQDEALLGLDPEDTRLEPKGGGHSIIWNLWHITRIEDVTMNLLVAGTPEVFRKANWPARLVVDLADVGNDMPKRDLARLNRNIDPKALLAYRLAVGRRTRQILTAMHPDEIWMPIEPERKKRLIAERVVRPQTHWLIEYWCGRRKADLLLMPPTRHCMVHLNEIRLIRKSLDSA